jgi:helicase
MERIERYFEDVPYVACENISMRLSRGITANPDSWESLVSVAQRVLGHYQNASRPLDVDVKGLYEEVAAIPLSAAARILNAASGAASKELLSEDELSDTTASEVSALSWLAASAYAAAGNFASATACLSKLDLARELTNNSFRRMSFALICPSQVGDAINYNAGDECDIRFLETLNEYRYSGDPKAYASASDLLDERLAACFVPFEVALLRSGRLALRHHKILSTVASLGTNCNLEPQLYKLLGGNAPATLLPAQWAVLNEGLLKNRDNTLITLPTSTGKTLLAQLAILCDLLGAEGGIGIFVAPYVAVARQTTESFKRLCANLRVSVTAMFAAGTDALDAASSDSRVIVLTPEKLEVLLGTGLRIDDIRVAVFDEAHLVENGVRGARLEALLTRFRLRQQAGSKCRLILMSATMDNVEEVREWMNVRADRHHEGAWRPTARRVALWEQSGRLSWVYGTDPVRPAGANQLSVRGSRQLPLAEGMYATEIFPQMRMQWPAAYKNVAYLVDQIGADIEGPALVVCMTRRATRGVANALADRFPEIDFGPELLALEDVIRSEMPHLIGLIRCLKHGVAFHNASLPPKIRARIEQALRAGEIRAVASTTTLAEGADLPFRLTVLYDWLEGFGDSQRPISPLLFRNIAGRAGRAGSYVEGDTIVFENVLGKKRYTQRTLRGSSLLDVISASPKLRSPFDQAVSDDKNGIGAVIEAAFIAAVSDNPEEGNVVEAFCANAFSSLVGFREELKRPLESAKVKVLSSFDTGGPIGIAASPIRLTPFGLAVRSTNLSPDSARAIMSMLVELNDLSVDYAVAELLLKCGAFPEQQSPKLRSLVSSKSARFVVKVGDLPTMSRVWRNDVPLFECFLTLPSVLNSKRKRFRDWCSGEDVPDWDAQYDVFLDFMESAFGAYVPILARAAQTLSEFTPGATRDDWFQIAQAFERRSDVDALDINELMATES